MIESDPQPTVNATTTHLWPRFSLRSVLIATALLAVALVVVNKAFRQPNDRARAAIESILRSSATPAEKLAALKPYVEVGENISEVNRRISARPDERLNIRRPTENSYMLDNASLVLTYTADGTINGVGRHVNGQDDGTFWLYPPNWTKR